MSCYTLSTTGYGCACTWFFVGQTPFEDDVIIDLDGDGLSCGTGDNFVSVPPEMSSDLVDMEAYALAKICQQKGVEFTVLNLFQITPIVMRLMIGFSN